MKCSIPKGTRDFLPLEMARRNYIFETIRNVFKMFAFEPIETPSIENLSTLMGKYGEEGDKLLFKILNSGDFMKDVDFSQDYHKVVPHICERGLRYDLTVPFARFVVQHRDDLVLPFRRYQLQPVWRADRPQKGRYREFYQCDADMIGSESLLNELELVQMIDAVFSQLNVGVTLKINNRKILAGIAELVGAPNLLIDITVAIDKLDKIGLDAVKAELAERGLTQPQIELLNPIFELNGSPADKLNQLEKLFEGIEVGQKGVSEMRELFGYIQSVQPSCSVELDLTLARGLNYYTGAIFEVKANNVSIGSICGGGRYDNLTGIFGMPNVSGVGISFGADRIYDVLTELNGFPEGLSQSARVLFINFGEAEQAYVLKCAAQFRANGIATLVYPDATKMKKQMDFANRKNIPFVLFVGESEITNHTVTIKNMLTGEQQTLPLLDAIAMVK
ncbi:MAG: histidine--tRNA ligase [Bacteroidales bacterium]|nr:histidine--tRNA ligase [Candidatus Colimorpha onthohippi]